MRAITTLLATAFMLLLAVLAIAPPVHAEPAATAAVTVPSILVTLVTTVWPLVAGVVSVPISRVLLNLNAAIDKLPAWAKQLVVAIVTFGLQQAAKLLGVPIPDSLAGFDAATVATLLGLVLPFFLHAIQKQQEAAAAPAK